MLQFNFPERKKIGKINVGERIGSRGLFRGQSGQTDNREEKSHRSVGPSLRRKSAAAAAAAALLDDRCNITQKPSSLRRRSWSFSVAIWTQDKSLSPAAVVTKPEQSVPLPSSPPDLNGLLSSSFPFGGCACIRTLCGIIRRGTLLSPGEAPTPPLLPLALVVS